MKRSTIAKTFAIAALALSLAPTAMADVTGCNNATLRGTFGYTLTGTLLATGLVGPFAEIGTQTFDGRGGTTASAMLSQNGNIFKISIKGTYIVNDDCTGTFTLQVSPFGITNLIFFVIDNGGSSLQLMEINPNQGGGSVVTGTGRRQFPVGDLRSN